MGGIMSIYEAALKIILKYEGGYVNNPVDKGGATNFGVTQGVYDAYRAGNAQQHQDVKLITQQEVSEIYHRHYWEEARCDMIETINPRLALIHFDTAVNCGTTRAAKMLQEVVGALPDGIIGNRTLTLVHTYRDFTEACNRYLNLRREFYQTIVCKNPKQKIFLKGWMNRIDQLSKVNV
jgi:lysozyme family protein